MKDKNITKVFFPSQENSYNKKITLNFLFIKTSEWKNLCLPNMVEYSCGFVGLRKGKMDNSPHISVYSGFTSALSQMSDIN